MSRRSFAVLAITAMLLVAVAPIGSAETNVQVPDDVVAEVAAAKGEASYIIVMEGDPLAATVGVDKLDSKRGEFQERKLVKAQDKALTRSGAGANAKVYSYTVALNGFSATLTEAEAIAMRGAPGVMFVAPDEIRYIQTDNTPDFLDLTARAGPYARGFDGEGVVVGVIDTGIWPEHASFADDGSFAAPPASFTGTGCEFGSAYPGATAFNPDDADFECNNKLLAAKAYGLGFHGGTGAGLDPGSFLSARDEDGHGTHTASTAAGNADVPATLQGGDLGTVSGIAPMAHVSVYKACWSVNPIDGGCATTDLVAAIDEAVADGVDVINYSIGSSSASIGADDISFLFAASAGVFVATSAGNDGPGAGTVGSPAVDPWVTSVGASTQSREFIGTVELGDGNIFEGITVTGGTDWLPLTDAADHGNELCDPAVTFAPAITDHMVLCKRGVFARVAKSQAVFEQGGAGMILYNPALQTLNTDNHYVPSLHVDHVVGPEIAAYIDAYPGTATAMLSGGQATPTDGNVMASFSSRGPNGLSEDIVKPDVTAPGVNILAGNTPAALLGSPGEYFQSISGTSMSSPHVAGIFALMKEAHPKWSPAIAKSALMTTAYQDVYKEDGATWADPFDFGAGHVNPGGPSNKGSMFQPGLAYDAGLFEYAAFTCGADLGVFTPGSCDFLESIGVPSDASDFNVASIGVAELVGSQTVVRTVTSVTRERGWRTYEASVEAPPGFDVTVSPSSLDLKRGMSATFEVTITNNGEATLGEWSYGSLTWNDTTGHYDVRSPIAVRAFEFAADAAVHGEGADGTADIDVSFGYDGLYEANPHGLVAATEQPGNVVDDPANDINTALGTGIGVTWHTVTVPAGTAYTRISLLDAYTDGDDDLDLYVWDSAFNFLGGSGSGTSAEQVEFYFPAADTLNVAVHGWQTDGPDSNYTLFDWSVPVTPGGSLVIDSAPAAAALGTTGTVTVSWSGLATGMYLGAVSHSGPPGFPAGLFSLTLVGVDVP